MRAWQANLVGVGVAGLVVGGGLFIGAPDAMADGPATPRSIGAAAAPPGEGSQEIPVGDSMMMWGRPSKLGLFWTSDSVEKIARTYGEAWQAAGQMVNLKRLDKVSIVSALDQETGLMRSVTIIDRDQERVVLPGLMDVRVAPDVSPRKAPVPVPENATAYMGHSADDATSISFNGSYQVPMAAEQVMAFYERELGAEGYKARTGKKLLKTGASIEFERDAEWISIVATDQSSLEGKAAEGADPLSVVIVTHVRTLTPPVEWKP